MLTGIQKYKQMHLQLIINMPLPALKYLVLLDNPLDAVSVVCFNALAALVELQINHLTDQQMKDFEKKLSQEPQMGTFKQALEYKQQLMKEMEKW